MSPDNHLLIENARLVTPHETITHGSLEIENGIIVAVNPDLIWLDTDGPTPRVDRTMVAGKSIFAAVC